MLCVAAPRRLACGREPNAPANQARNRFAVPVFHASAKLGDPVARQCGCGHQFEQTQGLDLPDG